MKKTRFRIGFLVLVVFIATYTVDEIKRSRKETVDLSGTFQQIDLPKDWITFYTDDHEYEYTFQGQCLVQKGQYELNERTIHFRNGPLENMTAIVQKGNLTFGNGTSFEKISQEHSVIGCVEDHHSGNN